MPVEIRFLSASPGEWLTAPNADAEPAAYRIPLRWADKQVLYLDGMGSLAELRGHLLLLFDPSQEFGPPCGTLTIEQQSYPALPTFEARVRNHPAFIHHFTPASVLLEVFLRVEGLESASRPGTTGWRWLQPRHRALDVYSMGWRSVQEDPWG